MKKGGETWQFTVRRGPGVSIILSYGLFIKVPFWLSAVNV